VAREVSTIAFAAALVFAAARCSSPTDSLPAGAVPFSPPAIYATWWGEVEQCSGKAGDFAAISWYYVPGQGDFTVGSNPDIVGVWQAFNHSITLAQSVWENPDVVRHEELHAILQRGDHPPEYFVQKCGSIVAH
jgi:hypothetical protein